MLIHFIKGEGELGREVIPDEDYYEEHTAESLYLLLSGMVTSDHQQAFTLKKTKELMRKGFTCVVFLKDELGHKIFIIPEPKRIITQ